MTATPAGDPAARRRLEGLIAAPHTPFDRSGDVNLAAIAQQVERLARDGVAGAWVSGTTGEGVSCTVSERKRVMDEWVRLARGRLLVIVHVGALSLRDAGTLAGHARDIGADAISLTPPSFFRPASVASLVDCVAEVASCAPATPLYYYHHVMSRVDLPMPRFLEAAERRVPTLAGIKFSDPDLHQFQECLRACGGKFDIAWGIDAFYAGAVALGAKVAVGSTYNFAAPLYHRIRVAVEGGRLAEAQAGMARVCRIVDVLLEYGDIAAGKAMMAVHGIDLGDVRLPLAPLAPAQKADIVARLRAILDD